MFLSFLYSSKKKKPKPSSWIGKTTAMMFVKIQKKMSSLSMFAEQVQHWPTKSHEW